MEDTKVLRIMCVVGFLAGAFITFSGVRHLQQTGQPPGRLINLGPFLLVFGAAYFIFPDRLDDRKFGWIVVIICVVLLLVTRALLVSR